MAQSTVYKTGPAPGIQWSKTYPVSGYGWPNSLCPTADGGYVITGMANDGDEDTFLIKTSAGGDQQWSKTFAGPEDDGGRSVVQAPDGGYVLAGYTYNSPNYADICLIKTDANGNEQWTWTYGTSGPDWGRAVIATDGGYLLAGYVHATDNNGYSGCDGYLVKVSPEGDQLWTRQYIEPGMYAETFDAMRETADGNYVIAGTVGKLDNKLCLVKVDRDGNQLWCKSFDVNGEQWEVGGVRQTGDGGYILTGGGGSSNTIFLLRADSDGKMLWFKEYKSDDHGFCGTVEQLPDGGFIAGGACLVRTDKDGNLLWAEITDPGFDSYSTAVIANGDGSYTVTGGARTSGNMFKPILVRTMAVEKAATTVTPTTKPIATQTVTQAANTAIASTTTPTARPSSVVQSGWDLGLITTAGIALGIFILAAGILVILLIIVLIVDERINRPRKR